jgi:hypothetical protein
VGVFDAASDAFSCVSIASTLSASPQVLHVAEGPARTRARLHLTVQALRALPQVLNVTEGTAPT